MTSETESRAYRRDILRYDKFAPTYEKMWVQKVRTAIHRNFLRRLEESGTEFRRILDIGCGTGALMAALRERYPGAELQGIDISPGMLAEAEKKREQGLRATFTLGAAERLPYPDGHFDLVVSTLCFHHWRSRTQGVAEVSRVLAPGGIFGLVDHFAIGWLRPTFALIRARDRVHTPAELERILDDAGLTLNDWRLVYSLGRLPYIHAVIAERPIDNSQEEQS